MVPLFVVGICGGKFGRGFFVRVACIGISTEMFGGGDILAGITGKQMGLKPN